MPIFVFYSSEFTLKTILRTAVLFFILGGCATQPEREIVAISIRGSNPVATPATAGSGDKTVRLSKEDLAIVDSFWSEATFKTVAGSKVPLTTRTFTLRTLAVLIVVGHGDSACTSYALQGIRARALSEIPPGALEEAKPHANPPAYAEQWEVSVCGKAESWYVIGADKAPALVKVN